MINELEEEFQVHGEKKFISAKAKIITIGDATFRSNFESGNLYSVERVANNAYKIMLEK